MPLVTISEQLGSGGMAIAKAVAEGLKLELYDDQRLQAQALKLALPSEKMKGLDEKIPGWFDRLLGKSPELYLDILEAVIYEVSRHGEGVIIGHGSQMLLRDFGCALHVHVHASKARRVQALMERHNLSQAVSEKLIRKSDSDRNRFFNFFFQRDLNDPSLYDLMLNTEKIGRDAATEFIMQLAGSNEISRCSLTALKSMEKLSKTKKLEAELLKNEINLALLQIDLPASGGVRISGLVRSPTEKERIKRVVTAMTDPGQSKIDVEVGIGL